MPVFETGSLPAANDAGRSVHQQVEQAQIQGRGEDGLDGPGSWRGMPELDLLAVEQKSGLHRPDGWHC